jgi:glycogen synthase
VSAHLLPGLTAAAPPSPQAGIMTADKVLTVSPNYASEIVSGPAKGVEMDSYLRAAGERRRR